MPTTTDKKKFSDHGPSQILDGGGGSPSGETTAPPQSIIDGLSWGRADGGLRQELVDEVVDRAAGRRRVRQALGVPSDRRISDEVIDELLAGASSEEEIAGPGGLLAQLTKRLVERAMEVELTEHVGYEPHQEPPGGTGNTRGLMWVGPRAGSGG